MNKIVGAIQDQARAQRQTALETRAAERTKIADYRVAFRDLLNANSEQFIDSIAGAAQSGFSRIVLLKYRVDRIGFEVPDPASPATSLDHTMRYLLWTAPFEIRTALLDTLQSFVLEISEGYVQVEVTDRDDTFVVTLDWSQSLEVRAV